MINSKEKLRSAYPPAKERSLKKQLTQLDKHCLRFVALSPFVVLSSGTLSTAVQEGTVLGVNHETGAGSAPVLDSILLRMFRGMLAVINLVQNFSPIDSLSTGRSITWFQLAQAFGQIVLLMGGLAAVIGMSVLTRRELATAQPKA